MTIDWVSSVAIAIPIGIVANLLTPLVSRQFERLNARYAEREQQRRQEEELVVTEMRSDRSKLYILLLVTGLKITLLYAFANIASQIVSGVTNAFELAGFGSIANANVSLWRVTSLLNSLITLFVSLVVLRIARQALVLTYAVSPTRGLKLQSDAQSCNAPDLAH